MQTISGENKTKPAVREEGKKLVKLFCWNRRALRANPKQDCGGVSEKKTCYQFLRGFITGCRDAWCVIHRENAYWTWVMVYSALNLYSRMNQFWATKWKKSISYLYSVKFMPLKVQLPALWTGGLHRLQWRCIGADQLRTGSFIGYQRNACSLMK